MNSLKKILLIDDDHLFGNTIKESLSPDKYQVIYAPTCASGIHKTFQHYPDIIFYNTNLDPLDGSEVFKALQLTSSFGHIPVVFYKDKEDEQIKNLLNNKVKGALAKAPTPMRTNLLMDARDEQHTKSDQDAAYDFNTLFNLAPNSMFIFDKKGILAINQTLKNLLKTNKQEVSAFRIEDLFDKPTLRDIKQWVKDHKNKGTSAFRQQVILHDRAGERIAMNLMIAELKRTEDAVHYLGTFQAVERTSPIFNYQLAQEVCNLLKRENMEVSATLEKKITQTIKLRAINEEQPKKTFFTRRENEVLRLSMEGLSIKIIADKLSLSTRTVEKYRTKLMLKSGAKNIVEVIVFSIKNNLLKI